MGDLKVIKHFEVQPNIAVHKLWCEQQIAEKEARVKRLEVDAEEIIKGRLKGMQADILMLKREIAALYDKADRLEQYNVEDVVDIQKITHKEQGE